MSRPRRRCGTTLLAHRNSRLRLSTGSSHHSMLYLEILPWALPIPCIYTTVAIGNANIVTRAYRTYYCNIRADTIDREINPRPKEHAIKVLTTTFHIDRLLDMASTQHKIAFAFCASFQNLDIDANLALRTPDCTHIFAPASLNFPPSMTNEQWAAHVQSLKAILSSFPVTPKEVFAQEGGNHVTIWATSDARFRDEVKDEDSELDWSYYGEYIFVLQLNQAGDRIERIVEFLDSKKVIDLNVVMARARVNVAARRESFS